MTDAKHRFSECNTDKYSRFNDEEKERKWDLIAVVEKKKRTEDKIESEWFGFV